MDMGGIIGIDLIIIIIATVIVIVVEVIAEAVIMVVAQLTTVIHLIEHLEMLMLNQYLHQIKVQLI